MPLQLVIKHSWETLWEQGPEPGAWDRNKKVQALQTHTFKSRRGREGGNPRSHFHSHEQSCGVGSEGPSALLVDEYCKAQDLKSMPGSGLEPRTLDWFCFPKISLLLWERYKDI